MAKQHKEELQFIFKGGPGTYGKGQKQTKEDDFVLLNPNVSVPSLPYIGSFSIYSRKNKGFSYNKTLNVIFFICVVIVLILNFLIDDFFITRRERNFEDLLSKLCFAFIGSYIFYNVVTKTTDKIKKREAYAVICGMLDNLVKHGKDVEKYVKIGAGKNSDYNISKLSTEEFRNLCELVNLNTIPPDNVQSISSLILLSGVSRIKHHITQIFTYMPFLESELVHRLNKIQNSKFTVFIILIPHKKIPNLKEYSLELLEFFDLIEQLENYNNKIKKKYLNKNYEITQL